MASKKSVVAQMVEELPFEATDMDFVRALRVYQAKELRRARGYTSNLRRALMLTTKKGSSSFCDRIDSSDVAKTPQ
ncbi:hypothetical protein GN244_ATG01321 [Phytophthora infestans]|uniref:Uncharacterized protein n=1 Tax=Phytophthora infestans TaxID=4787 RepID=A0A833T414_PHYIN|nr:hypothetical protein GN244_ATG01321 [Phytophthora infestans]